MENTSEEILGITVSPTGAAHIRKLSKTIHWLFRLGILHCLITIVNAFIRVSYMNPDRFSTTNPSEYWYEKLYVWYTGSILVLFFAQLYFYLRFAKRINKALYSLDSQSFNDSFAFLNQYTVYAIAGNIINMLIYIPIIGSNYHYAHLHGQL